MKLYSIFDDFDETSADIIRTAGLELTIHPFGVPRPDSTQMKEILEDYDGVIIGTSQKITEQQFEHISTPRIIATASVGLDHIQIPEDKRSLVTIINTPKANAQSVAEYTLGCALSCCKRFTEGASLYRRGLDNKKLHRKPEDLNGKTMGVVGAGNISVRVMDFAFMLGMNVLCWTRHPEHHDDLRNKGVQFASLEDLVSEADFISVNLPNNSGTKGLISAEIVARMKETAVFISVSRLDTVDALALFDRAKEYAGFYVCLDIDLNDDIVHSIPDLPNVMVTPHIAGGTVETRRRMFRELADEIVEIAYL